MYPMWRLCEGMPTSRNLSDILYETIRKKGESRMRKIACAFISCALFLTMLAGCSSKDQLVSKEPFPTFSEVDMEGNQITEEVFSDYDVTIVNFWNNG